MNKRGQINVVPILRAGMAIQAVSLLGHNVAASRKLLSKKRGRGQKPLKTITRTAMTNIIGIPLLRVQGQLIGQL